MAESLVPEELWRRVEPLLPKRRRSRHRRYAGRRPVDNRRAFEGIVFAVKTGVPWSALPAASQWPRGVTCWRRLTQCHRAGVWKRMFESLLAEMQARGLLHRARADGGQTPRHHPQAPHPVREDGPTSPSDVAAVHSLLLSAAAPCILKYAPSRCVAVWPAVWKADDGPSLLATHWMGRRRPRR
ncbi:transposase [Stigmatella aurantiaca]